MAINAGSIRAIMNKLDESDNSIRALAIVEDAMVDLQKVDKAISSIEFDDALYQFDAENGTSCQKKKEEALELLRKLRPMISSIYNAVNK